jgi:hypothetical protein
VHIQTDTRSALGKEGLRTDYLASKWFGSVRFSHPGRAVGI